MSTRSSSSPSAAAFRARRGLAGGLALALPLLGLLPATSAAAQEALPDVVTVPGSYGRLLECAGAFDIDCPTLDYAPETGDFRGTFELPAGQYQYYAFVTTGPDGAGYGPQGPWTGEYYTLDHPGGEVTFVYDPATRLVRTGDAEGVLGVGPDDVLLTRDNTAATAEAIALGAPAGADVFAGDWDGDGVDTIGWRAGTTFTFTSANENGGGERTTMAYGAASDEVLVGDFDGDGVDTIGVRRGNRFLLTQDFDGSTDVDFWYGLATDDVVVADFDGDGTDTVSVRRGNAFHVNNSLKGGNADRVFWYGMAGEPFLVGDLTGSGIDTITIRRGSQYHLKYSLTSGNADRVVYVGDADDDALLGDWDGDGVDTLGVHLR